MNTLASNGEIADPCGVPRSRVTSVPSGCCIGACSHRLRDPICDGRHPEHPYAFPASLGDFHGFDRGRKVTPGRHAIPNPVQVLVAVLLELSDRHLIHPSRTLVGFDPLIRLPHNPFRDVKRPVLLLRLAHPTPPGTAG